MSPVRLPHGGPGRLELLDRHAGLLATAIIFRSRASIRAAASGIFAAMSGARPPRRAGRRAGDRRAGSTARPLHRDAEVDHMDVGVGDGHVRREELEADGLGLGQVRTVPSVTTPRPERAVDVGLHLAPVRPLAAGLVDVVHHDDAGAGGSPPRAPTRRTRWSGGPPRAAARRGSARSPRTDRGGEAREAAQTMSEDTKPVLHGLTLNVSIALATVGDEMRDSSDRIFGSRARARSCVLRMLAVPGSDRLLPALAQDLRICSRTASTWARLGSTASAFSKYSAARGRSSFWR